jgi:hypothetical protein
MAFYQGMLTLHWNYYGTYVCIPGQVTIIDSDETGPRTRVYAIRHVWAPTVMPYLCQVMSASIPRDHNASHAYPVHGSTRVGWLDAWLPPGSS